MTLRLLKPTAAAVSLPPPGPRRRGRERSSPLRDMIQQKSKEDVFTASVSMSPCYPGVRERRSARADVVIYYSEALIHLLLRQN